MRDKWEHRLVSVKTENPLLDECTMAVTICDHLFMGNGIFNNDQYQNKTALSP